MTAVLEADVTVERGGFGLDVAVTCGAEVVAVVGPNGAGKSTLLRAVAGLEPVTAGRVVLHGRVLTDGAHAVPPEQRRIGVVFQSHLLFPHLTARDNVAFGPRSQGVPAVKAARAADDWLERVGLAAHAGQRPAELSGGQAQRVALARALACEPDALLLDEPLAALDVATRHEVRTQLRAHLAAFDGPVLLVTHDAVEAATLGDRMMVLEDGRVTHDGDVGTITRQPRTPWAARLAGLNLYAGQADGTTVTLDGGGQVAVADPAGGPVWVTVAPAAVALYREPPSGSPRNVWPVHVAGLEATGDRVRVDLHGTPPVTAEVTTAAARSLDLAGGGRLWATVKATEISVYPR